MTLKNQNSLVECCSDDQKGISSKSRKEKKQINVKFENYVERHSFLAKYFTTFIETSDMFTIGFTKTLTNTSNKSQASFLAWHHRHGRQAQNENWLQINNLLRQCNHIGIFSIDLCYKFCFKSSPNIWLYLGVFVN